MLRSLGQSSVCTVHTPVLGAPSLGQTLTLAHSLAVRHVGLAVGFQRDLSTSHKNMPGLVSEPALLKTWSAAVASPSPALHDAKTFSSPDLAQASCLPKALIPVSLMSKHLAESYHPSTLLAQFTWRTEAWKGFSKALWEACDCGKFEHPSPTHSHFLSLVKHLPTPFPSRGDYATVSGATALTHPL